jgi:hypothetical protein
MKEKKKLTFEGVEVICKLNMAQTTVNLGLEKLKHLDFCWLLEPDSGCRRSSK